MFIIPLITMRKILLFGKFSKAFDTFTLNFEKKEKKKLVYGVPGKQMTGSKTI